VIGITSATAGFRENYRARKMVAEVCPIPSQTSASKKSTLLLFGPLGRYAAENKSAPAGHQV
jgi:hypothetical protein